MIKLASTFIFLTFLLTASSFATEKPTKMGERKLTVNGKDFLIVVDSVSSMPGSPNGYCGAGEEIILHVFGQPGKKEIFKTLIASCLQNIELNTDNEANAVKPHVKWNEEVMNSLTLDKNPIAIPWTYHGDAGKSENNDVTGFIDLSVPHPQMKISPTAAK